MDEGIDTGDIILRRLLAIAHDDTALTLQRRLTTLWPGMVGEVAALMERGNCPRQKQDEHHARHWPRRKPEDGRIDWNWPAERIYNLIRALVKPWPGAFFETSSGDPPRVHGVRRTCEVETSPQSDWRGDIIKTLQTNYGRAPHFREVFAVAEPLIRNPEATLAEYNLNGIRTLARHLRIDVGKIVRSSTLPVEGARSAASALSQWRRIGRLSGARKIRRERHRTGPASVSASGLRAGWQQGVCARAIVPGRLVPPRLRHGRCLVCRRGADIGRHEQSGVAASICSVDLGPWA
jgi:hypothetical protein